MVRARTCATSHALHERAQPHGRALPLVDSPAGMVVATAGGSWCLVATQLSAQHEQPFTLHETREGRCECSCGQTGKCGTCVHVELGTAVTGSTWLLAKLIAPSSPGLLSTPTPASELTSFLQEILVVNADKIPCFDIAESTHLHNTWSCWR